MKQLAVIITIILCILKMVGVFMLSWWAVFSPVIVVAVIHLIMSGVLMISYYVASRTGTPEQRAKFKRIWDDQNREAEQRKSGKSKWQMRMEQMQEAQRKATQNIPSVKTIIVVTVIAGTLASCSSAKNIYGCPANPIHKPKFKR